MVLHRIIRQHPQTVASEFLPFSVYVYKTLSSLNHIQVNLYTLKRSIKEHVERLSLPPSYPPTQPHSSSRFHQFCNLLILKYAPTNTYGTHLTLPIRKLPKHIRYRMCVSIVEAHLCGWRGSVIRTERCLAEVAISQLVDAVFAAQDEECLIYWRRECERNSETRDEVRIDWNCTSCVEYYEHLGRLEAQLRCVDMERASRRRRCGRWA